MFRRDFLKKSEDIAVSRLAMTGGHPRRGGAGDESMVSMGDVPGERERLSGNVKAPWERAGKRTRLGRWPSSDHVSSCKSR